MELTHFDEHGNARMVDVSAKNITSRTATACGTISVGNAVFEHIKNGTAAKGDVLNVARIAGIMATKRTGDLIPMCHPLLLTKVTVDFALNEEKSAVTAYCTVKTDGKTGVEMEALTGVQVALLTIYDMCKAIDKGMVMSDIHLVEKSGGKSGNFRFQEDFRKPYLLAVSGFKNSGKTTLIDKLIPLFVQDHYKVAVIKHDGHSFTPGVPETDSARHFAAGAYGSLVFDGEKYMLVHKNSETMPSPETFFPDADIILLEGFKYSDYPKIELGQRKDTNMPELYTDKVISSGICHADTVLCYVSDVLLPYHDGKTCFSYDETAQIYAFILKHMKEFYET